MFQLLYIYHFSSVTQPCLSHCDPMDFSKPGLAVHHQLPELTQTHIHRVGDAINHLILYRPLLLPPSIFPSTRVFSNESALHIRWPKDWSFSFSTSFLASSISTHLSDLQESRCHHSEWSLYWSREISSPG